MHQLQPFLRLQDGKPRPPQGRRGQEHDVALDDRGRRGVCEGTAAQQPRDLLDGAQRGDRLGPEGGAQPPARGGRDGAGLVRRRVEHDVAGLKEGARVLAAGARERVAQQVLVHLATAHVDRTEQCHVGAAFRRAAPRARGG